MATAAWTPAHIPGQQGRIALVTGATSGTGFETARVLAARGATVVLGCRNPSKAEDARLRILAAHPAALVEVLDLDLASLASVRRAAEACLARHPRLDLLINNAGVMVPPYGRTVDGFETQIGTNHFGPFALTGLLLDRLRATPGSRIVTMSSGAHRIGRIQFDDLHSERRYRPWAAYGQSKLANLLFTFALDRRLGGTGPLAVAAHPGWARTGLQRHVGGGLGVAMALTAPLLSQDAAGGALPLLRAATDPGARGGDYFGPTGLLEFKGAPGRVQAIPLAHDRALQDRFWQLSEQVTGVTYGG